MWRVEREKPQPRGQPMRDAARWKGGLGLPTEKAKGKDEISRRDETRRDSLTGSWKADRWPLPSLAPLAPCGHHTADSPSFRRSLTRNGVCWFFAGVSSFFHIYSSHGSDAKPQRAVRQIIRPQQICLHVLSSVLVLVPVLLVKVNRLSLLLFLVASHQPNLLGHSRPNRLEHSTNSRLSPSQPSGLTPPNKLV